MQEMFCAEAGCGASLNGKEIHVSETPFDKALVAFGTAPYHMELAMAYLHSCANVRRIGSAAINPAYLACGRRGAFFDLNLKPWDYAAGSLIVQRSRRSGHHTAGARKMQHGRSAAILASSAVIADEIAAVLACHIGGSKCRTIQKHPSPGRHGSERCLSLLFCFDCFTILNISCGELNAFCQCR